MKKKIIFIVIVILFGIFTIVYLLGNTIRTTNEEKTNYNYKLIQSEGSGEESTTYTLYNEKNEVIQDGIEEPMLKLYQDNY